MFRAQSNGFSSRTAIAICRYFDRYDILIRIDFLSLSRLTVKLLCYETDFIGFDCRHCIFGKRRTAFRLYFCRNFRQGYPRRTSFVVEEPRYGLSAKQREILLRRSLSFCSRCEQCGRQSDGCVDRYERRGLNTQSYNLVEVKPGEERGEANGRVMRRALEVCATVKDFRQFLDTLSKPSLIEANFGVIDAKGGAAMFEVDYYEYVMYDANNPKDAPCGYIARTNFSFSGKVNEGAGYVRFMQEDKLLMPASATGQITPQWIFRELSRSFANPLLGIDLKSGDFNRPKTTGWFVDQDFIARSSTASSVVVQGVREGERPELTTMWTILGYPPTGVAMPVWVKGADKALPRLQVRDEAKKVSPLGNWSVILAGDVFSYGQGMGSNRYMNWERLYNADKNGYMQLLAPVEDEVFRRTVPVLKEWRRKGEADVKAMRSLYNELDAFIEAEYAELFEF